MTRRKVKLAFIANKSDRKASYKKRKGGLMKKVQELSTLCGIEACAILYGPYDNKPEVWPPNPDAVNRVLARFNDLPEVERLKRMVTQEGFTKHRLEKTKEHLKKLIRDNREMEITDLVNKCLDGTETVERLGLTELNDMGWLIQRNLKEITRRIAFLQNHGPEGAPPAMNEEPVETGINANLGGIGDDGSSSMVAAAPQMPMIGGDGSSSMVGAAPQMPMIGGDGSPSVVAAAPQMPMIGGDGSSSMVAAAPQMPMIGGDGSSSMVVAAPQMPLIRGEHQMKNLTWDMGMLNDNEQQPGIDYFGWDYNLFQQPPIVNDNIGADPSYTIVNDNLGAGPNYCVNNNIGFGPNYAILNDNLITGPSYGVDHNIGAGPSYAIVNDNLGVGPSYAVVNDNFGAGPSYGVNDDIGGVSGYGGVPNYHVSNYGAGPSFGNFP